MWIHTMLTDIHLHRLIRKGTIRWGGNGKLKIYGKLNCQSGKRMKKTTRVFFESEDEALKAAYRPCGHCLKEAYKNWKDGLI